MSLNVSAILPARPVQVPGRRTEKSPSRTVRRPARITPSSGEACASVPAERAPLDFVSAPAAATAESDFFMGNSPRAPRRALLRLLFQFGFCRTRLRHETLGSPAKRLALHHGIER